LIPISRFKAWPHALDGEADVEPEKWWWTLLCFLSGHDSGSISPLGSGHAGLFVPDRGVRLIVAKLFLYKNALHFLKSPLESSASHFLEKINYPFS